MVKITERCGGRWEKKTNPMKEVPNEERALKCGKKKNKRDQKSGEIKGRQIRKGPPKRHKKREVPQKRRYSK